MKLNIHHAAGSVGVCENDDPLLVISLMSIHTPLGIQAVSHDLLPRISDGRPEASRVKQGKKLQKMYQSRCRLGRCHRCGESQVIRSYTKIYFSLGQISFICLF